jgi:CxxC motif-containing protein
MPPKRQFVRSFTCTQCSCDAQTEVLVDGVVAVTCPNCSRSEVWSEEQVFDSPEQFFISPAAEC